MEVDKILGPVGGSSERVNVCVLSTLAKLYTIPLAIPQSETVSCLRLVSTRAVSLNAQHSSPAWLTHSNIDSTVAAQKVQQEKHRVIIEVMKALSCRFVSGKSR